MEVDLLQVTSNTPSLSKQNFDPSGGKKKKISSLLEVTGDVQHLVLNHPHLTHWHHREIIPSAEAALIIKILKHAEVQLLLHQQGNTG